MSFLAIFIASLFGSLHCVGMCGGFVAIAGNSNKPSLSIPSYHLGRLIAYASLGAIAGAIGETFNHLGIVVGIQSVAPIATGILLLWWGILALKKGVLPAPAGRLWKKASSLLKSDAPLTMLFLGCFSAFLPCGWLYVFLVTSASFGEPIRGALAMTAFWIGTVPALSIFSTLTRGGLKLSRLSPTVIAFLLIFAGAYSISSHLYGLNTENHGNISCHDHVHE